jgi:hypothetical protein
MRQRLERTATQAPTPPLEKRADVAARSQARRIWPDFLVVMCVPQADAEGRNNPGVGSAPWNARAIDRCAQRRESRGVVVLLALIALGVAFADVPAQYRGLW